MSTSQDVEHIFQTEIRQELFDDVEKPTRPLLLLIGGQPAAGKTAGANRLESRFTDQHLVTIEGDAFRRYDIKNYLLSYLHDPLSMPAATAEFSGNMVRRCLNYAFAEGYSVSLEGTFRSLEMASATIKEASQAGYEIVVAGVATRPVQSRLAAEGRFLGDYANGEVARWTPADAQQRAIENYPSTLAGLEALPEVSEVVIFDRTGQILYPQPGIPSAREALESEWNRPWNSTEIQDFQRSYQEIHALAQNVPGYLERNADTWKYLGTAIQKVENLKNPPPPPKQEPPQTRQDLAKGIANLVQEKLQRRDDSPGDAPKRTPKNPQL